MDKNLEIIQQIFQEAIRLDCLQDQNIEVNYHSGSKRLRVEIAYQGNPTFNDGLTRSYSVSVKNSDLLNKVLCEIKALEIIDDDLLGD
ncbi:MULTISPECIES: hypothetical protein [Clostridium]|uniref:hypothetical protein n=1 Tax=Clostridium TaxID=1485 RepID=UPI000A16EA02|nr:MULTISPECIES: hypothetical protein [Clostridium]MBN1070468.1 hypothetical protein [Clostridium botulinum]NFO41791.1 hypothetical protein [Clostridium botulinum]